MPVNDTTTKRRLKRFLLSLLCCVGLALNLLWADHSVVFTVSLLGLIFAGIPAVILSLNSLVKHLNQTQPRSVSAIIFGFLWVAPKVWFGLTAIAVAIILVIGVMEKTLSGGYPDLMDGLMPLALSAMAFGVGTHWVMALFRRVD